MFLHFNYNFFTLLQQTLYLGCGNTALPLTRSVLLAQINTNIVARSVLFIFVVSASKKRNRIVSVLLVSEYVIRKAEVMPMGRGLLSRWFIDMSEVCL